MISTLLRGEAAQVLETLQTESVHSIVTSPPYWALRDYRGDPDQLGQEPDPDLYVERIVGIFREGRRVLRRDGTCWVNLGDTYRNKKLQLIPARVALAMQRDGWWLRGEMIWDKPNVCPESVRDRPTRSHEHVFLFSRRGRYYYDQEAVRTPNTAQPNLGKRAAALQMRNKGESIRFAQGGKHAQEPGVRGGFVGWNPRGRNLRSVWRQCTQPFHAKSVGIDDVDHFAVMAPNIVRTCILASTPAGGVCAQCGTPQRRILALREEFEDTWVPTCSCTSGEIVPATVLDPFCGSGTTPAVAIELGRSAIGIDLSDDYLRLAAARIEHARARPSPPRKEHLP